MHRLEQMADQGVEIGRLLTEQARVAAACAATDAVPDNLPHAKLLNEIAGAHARVVRAVAIASAVEDRIDRGLPALPELDQARRRREDLAAEKRALAACEVDRALDSVPLSPRRLAHIRVDLRRLLDAETADLDRFLARPLPELAARLRRDLGLELSEEDEAWLEGGAPPPENPPPVRGGVTSDGPQGGPYAIANDLAIAARNAAAQAEAGPVAQQREGGVTDADRQPTPPAIRSAFDTVRAARLQLRASVTPSSQSPPATGAHPSPGGGRISRVHPPP
jgi:hypothetical protein